MALAGLVGSTTWATPGVGGAQSSAPAGGQAPGASQLIPPAPQPDAPPPPPQPATSTPPLAPAAQPTPSTPRATQPAAGAAAAPAAAPGLPAPGIGGEGVAITEMAEPTREILVVLGRSKLIQTERPIGRIVIADPRIADIQLLDAEQPNQRLVAIYGRTFGLTNLTIWDQEDRATSYTINVAIDVPDLQRRIKTVFPGAEVRVQQLGQQILLEGQVPDNKTMSEVLQLVTSMLLGTPLGAPGAAGAQSVSGAGGPGGAALPSSGGTSGGSNTMGMGASSMSTSAASVGGGANLPAGTIINRVHVPGPRQVMLHVKIAELNRTALRQIGVSWLDTRNQAILGSTIGAAGAVGGTSIAGQAGQFFPGKFVQGSPRVPGIIQPVASNFSAQGVAGSLASSQLFGIFNAGEFNLFINALRQNQLAKILAEPNLMTLDGQPARFQAGGSFPFPVPQSTAVGGASVAVTIQFRDFGAILQFLPHILANDVIRLDVAPTFSELNPATGVTVLGTTVPGINQREARTVVELREGQTLAIAGLLQTRTTAQTVRIPGLGDLPIVGPWFSHNDITTVETELVVLVTPELVAPMEKCDVPPAPGDRVLQPNDYEFYFLGRIEGKTGHPFRSTVHQFDPLDVMKHFQSENLWVVGPHGHAD